MNGSDYGSLLAGLLRLAWALTITAFMLLISAAGACALQAFCLTVRSCTSTFLQRMLASDPGNYWPTAQLWRIVN